MARRLSWPFALLLCLVPAPRALADGAPPPALPEAIEDNSFLVEEAYNQESRVVQHIFNVAYTAGDAGDEGRWDATFTQEWPVGGPRHQLSYTVPYSWVQGDHGWGNVFLNYRFQALGHDRWAALAPRFSLVLPTASGSGDTGFQAGVPASRRLGARWAAHANAFYTYLHAPDVADRHALNAGGSLILLANPVFNVMLEALSVTVWQQGGSDTSWILNPGVRGAINHGSLQVVPGAAVTFVRSDGRTRTGAFLYLSFEHPF